MGAGGKGVVACREFENLGKPTKSQSYVYSRRVLATLNTVSSKIPLPQGGTLIPCSPGCTCGIKSHLPLSVLGKLLEGGDHNSGTEKACCVDDCVSTFAGFGVHADLYLVERVQEAQFLRTCSFLPGPP